MTGTIMGKRMKHVMFFILLLMGASMPSMAQQPAFPGAEGYGKYTTGGRGGKVYYVTSLADCTDDNLIPGTLRWALRDGDDTPRTVLFNVCGTIYLNSKLKLAHPNITIAGQTAPGGGICIAGANIYVCKPNVIIRYIRFRAGDIPMTNFPCLDVENTKNVIIDHCSMTWSMEECLTMYDCDSTTVQWTIIGEGLYNSKHKKGSRAYATQWGGEHSTMHHCLITNCYNRCPRFNGVRDEADLQNGKHNHDAQVDSEFANNVIFNWGKQNSLYGGECDTTKNRVDGVPMGYNRITMMNNYFRPGPTTKKCLKEEKYRFVKGDTQNGFGEWYLNGNYMEASADLAINQDNYSGWLTQAPTLSVLPNTCYMVTESASDAMQRVCQMAGAQLPRLDEEDQRLLAEALGEVEPKYAGATQSAWLGIIDSQDDIRFTREDSLTVGDSRVGGYPYLGIQDGDKKAIDTDGDGMPDKYEREQGLNPNDATDGAAVTESGYTNLEVYLNAIADGLFPKSKYEGDEEQGCIVPTVASPARKMLINGMLYIEQNGKRINVLGF